jgi:hypothetical protein
MMTVGTKKPPHPETVREHGSSKLEPPQEAEPAPEPAELKVTRRKGGRRKAEGEGKRGEEKSVFK